MKKILLKLLASLLLASSLTGCSETKTSIAYTVYPIGWLVDRLTGSTEYSVSIQEDEIVQRAQIRDDYAQILADSALFLYIGDLEPYRTVYADAIKTALGSSSSIDLSVMNAVYDFQRYTPVYIEGEDTTYVESPYYRDDSMDSIDMDAKDLYLWIDPIAMLSMAKDIRDWLVSYYPDSKDTINSNFDKLQTDLINLDAQYQALATRNDTEGKEIRFVTMTASFGNWQKTYGFQVYPIILSKYGVLPNETQLQVIEDRIARDGVQYIVYEPNMTDDMIALFDRVQNDLDLTRVELSNLSSLSQDQDDQGKDYLSIMYENLSVLETMRQDRQTTSTAADTAEDTAEASASAEATSTADSTAAG